MIAAFASFGRFLRGIQGGDGHDKYQLSGFVAPWTTKTPGLLGKSTLLMEQIRSN